MAGQVLDQRRLKGLKEVTKQQPAGDRHREFKVKVQINGKEVDISRLPTLPPVIGCSDLFGRR